MTTLHSDLGRSRRPAQAVRPAILEAALALLAEEGADALSMRRLADRCGYTVPTIYHHFGDKLGLVEAALDEVFGALVEELEAVPRGGDPVAFLRAMVRVFVSFGLRLPAQYGLLMVPVSGQMPMPATVERARELLDEALAALDRGGRLAEPDPRRAAQVIWIASHGLISLPSLRPDIEWVADLCEAALDAVLHGLVKQEEGAR